MKNGKIIVRTILVSSVLLMVLFVIGCGGSDQQTLQKNYKQGYALPTLVIDEQRSPSVFYQNRPFSLTLTLFNRAGYPLQNVKVAIANYDQTFLSIANPQQFFPLIEENNAFNDDNGGRVDLVFAGDVRDLRGAEERREPYRLYASYDSKMEFAPTICVNAARYDVFDAGCQMPKSKVSFSGQGAPLAVTSMEEIVLSGDVAELELRLRLENKGNGDLKNIRLGQARLGNTPLACQFKNVLENADKSVSFKSNRKDGEVLCTATLTEKSSYQTALFIEFFYSYELSVARQMTIKR
ncbi:hypothetical protein HY495_02610 [Candidatus Woesearchaeota archaeon]|nr:hypothetical protein [Candidatus Woesearchaeota archaeon]